MPNSPNTLAPSAIIFIDPNFGPSTLQVIQRQFFLTDDQVITGAEFDARVAADPNYPNEIHGSNSRLLVLRPLNDFTNRNLADLVIKYSNGLLIVEKSKFGPPNISFPLDRITLIELILLQTNNQLISGRNHKCKKDFPF